MNSATPASPTARGAQQQGAQLHLHHRTLSTSTRITLPSVPTTPPSKRSYRLVPDSPSTRRARKQVLRSKHRVREWVEEHLGKGVTLKQLAVWICVVGTLLLVVLQFVMRGNVLGRFGTSGMVEVEQGTFALGKEKGTAPSKPLVVAEPAQLDELPPRPPLPPNPPRRKPIYKPRPPAPKKVAPVYVKVEPATSETTAEPAAGGRYLLVAWMGEQETKAQQHLYHLGLLAISLNRTLVLPNVQKSRFGTCFDKPFSLYYAADTLDSFGIPYITTPDFIEYTKQDKTQVPTAQLIAMSRGAPVPDDQAFMSRDRFCLHNTRLDTSRYAPRAFFSPSNDHKSPEARAHFAEKVIRTLLEDEESKQGSPDVLVFQYNLRYPLLTPSLAAYFAPSHPTPAPYSYFHYSPHWTLLGTQLAASLSPYIAIHWRTETLEVTSLAQCGSSLIRRMTALKAEHPEVRKVYLAMDYPIEGLQGGAGSSHSGTMDKLLTEEHHEAMRGFLADWEAAFGEMKEEGERLELTSFVKEQGALQLSTELKGLLGGGKVDFQELDGAIVGIVDKIVLMQAQVFIAGDSSTSSNTEGKCGKNSQFTEQVIAGRKSAWAEQGRDRRLWNKVGHFSMDGESDD